jgi:glycosyltransferase involved in cell wall biosynthesis
VANPRLVSVIIPVYRQAQYLGDTIQSVLDQTHRNFEIIVIDDGSPDNPSEVAARFPAAQYFRQENSGVCAARNAGFQRSRGDFAVFLDGDDRLLPRALEIGVSALEENSGCGLTTGYHRYIDKTGSPLPTLQPQRIVERDHYLELLRSNYIGCPATVMFRREAVEAVGGFHTPFAHSADYSTYLRVARTFPIHCNGQCVAEYRLHGENNSLNLEIMLRDSVGVLREELEFVKGKPQLEEACLSGIRFNDRLFRTEQSVARLRAHVRENRLTPAVAEMMFLLRYNPAAFRAHLGRALGRLLTTRRIRHA